MKEYKIEIPGAISGDFRQDIFRCDHNEIADQLETSLRHRDVFAIPSNPETKRRSLAVLRFSYWAKEYPLGPELVFARVILLLIHHNKHVFDNKY